MNGRDKKTAPRQSQVISVMDIGVRYKASTLAAKFDIATTTMTTLLRTMAELGSIQSMVEGTQRKYLIPVDQPPAAPDAVARNPHVFTPPLDGSMSKARDNFVAGCMAVRRV
jgi:hypothetical protein